MEVAVRCYVHNFSGISYPSIRGLMSRLSLPLRIFRASTGSNARTAVVCSFSMIDWCSPRLRHLRMYYNPLSSVNISEYTHPSSYFPVTRLVAREIYVIEDVHDFVSKRGGLEGK